MPPDFPTTLAIDVQLDDSPRYKGTIHDDTVARAAGYRAALVPGAFVYGHMSRVAIAAWGLDWARQGAMSARFLRPVFNHDLIRLQATALQESETGMRSDITVKNAGGETVATGWISQPQTPEAAPDLAALPIKPLEGPPRQIRAGALLVDMPLYTQSRVLLAEDIALSRAAFDERHPIYISEGIAHSGCLMRLSMGQAYSGYRFPSPVVLIQTQAQHFALVQAGQSLAISGRITDVYERKGRHYFVTDEWLIADGLTIAARFCRTSIYA